ncbi:ABC transporter ATP-binding protein [Gordonia westfalica]|uniref:ABC-2 type transport system ATP-binding protein n=1 Tax=Gordonia westfalica TaxID=158898 RepID=A0A1H2HRG4_9ACTN|nr:ABC transporter ATP-binding protein [Gordonia westfalica]SDU34503.1 ABC-2 type transport system ATP-binding protein [Gordonia westfalica]
MAAIAIKDLAKSFGHVRALDGFDLTVEDGEVHGFLGPNGAGKTTAIRVLLGLLRSDSGVVRVLERDPWRDNVNLHGRIAYVPGEVNLWPGISGGEVIDLLCNLRGDRDRRRRDELIDRFDLDPRKKARTYSKGNRQKVALIAALASDAELLLLDEPTAGLDPLKEAEFQRCIEEERRRGRTVLLSSHILAQVETLCDRVTLIRAGRTVDSGSLSELRHLGRLEISAETTHDPARLDDVPGVHDLIRDGHRIRCTVDAAALDTVVRELATLGVRDLTSAPPTLEDIFLRHYGD